MLREEIKKEVDKKLNIKSEIKEMGRVEKARRPAGKSSFHKLFASVKSAVKPKSGMKKSVSEVSLMKSEEEEDPHAIFIRSASEGSKVFKGIIRYGMKYN